MSMRSIGNQLAGNIKFLLDHNANQYQYPRKILFIAPGIYLNDLQLYYDL